MKNGFLAWTLRTLLCQIQYKPNLIKIAVTRGKSVLTLHLQGSKKPFYLWGGGGIYPPYFFIISQAKIVQFQR